MDSSFCPQPCLYKSGPLSAQTPEVSAKKAEVPYPMSSLVAIYEKPSAKF
jgi:hypothetical protein